MKLISILFCITVIQAGVIKKPKCDDVKINGVHFEREILHENLDRPYLLAVDYSNNILYFSYGLGTNELFESAKLNLNNKEFEDIGGVNNGFAQAVDQKSHEIYIGGSDGIYKYNHDKNIAEFYIEKDTNIWTLYFKDVLYFSAYPYQFLYTYIDSQTVRFPDLEDTKVDKFLIDNENDMFFTNATGLYSQKKGTKNSVLYKEFPITGVRGLTTDLNGKVFVCLQDGIYSVNKSNVSLDKIVDIDDGFGLAFDNKNNIIYSDATKLVRLKPSEIKSDTMGDVVCDLT